LSAVTAAESIVDQRAVGVGKAIDCPMPQTKGRRRQRTVHRTAFQVGDQVEWLLPAARHATLELLEALLDESGWDGAVLIRSAAVSGDMRLVTEAQF
jgi:hypothetical protein